MKMLCKSSHFKMRFYEPKTLGKLNHTTYINENKKALLQYFGHCPWGQPFFLFFITMGSEIKIQTVHPLLKAKNG